MDFFDLRLDSPEEDKSSVYSELQKALEDNPNDVHVLWRLTRTALILSDEEEKRKARDACKKRVEEAVAHARRAVAVDDKSFEAHKWLCASVGRIAPMVGVKERIAFGHEFKSHADLALSLEPNDRLMHHMLGRWRFEVSQLSWMERKLAATFFGTPPEATLEEALESLLKANELREEWISNHLWLSKVFLAQKKIKEALNWIESGLKIKVVSDEDSVAREELLELEKKWSKKKF